MPRGQNNMNTTHEMPRGHSATVNNLKTVEYA